MILCRREYFTPALNELFDQVYSENMDGSGISFDFGPEPQLPADAAGIPSAQDREK